MKLLSIVTPCFNEQENIEELVRRIRHAMALLPNYRYEHIFIDNRSTDDTVAQIKRLATDDRRIKLIVNARNFGHIRSGFHCLMQANGDAAIMMVSDLQDPPEMIPALVSQWEQGYKTVMAVKPESRESTLMFAVRKTYYRLVSRISDVPLIRNATGFGLYDRSVIDILRKMDDRYPYFRGLVCEIGFPIATVPYVQPRRERGISKNNFYTLYDMAMLGITSHSKVPLRLATMAGFALSLLSLLVAFGYLIAKLVYWDTFSVGMAPILIGVFFFASVQLFFIGMLGENI
jgi:glycosyltransferase involved in cell wall biosynthesis